MHVLAAGRLVGGGGLPVGSVRRHPHWGFTFVTAGTGRYRDADHDEVVAAGTLVVVRPGRPHWYGPDGGGWDEVFAVFDGPVVEAADRAGRLGSTPLLRLPVQPWAQRLGVFAGRARPVDDGSRAAEGLRLLAMLVEAAGAAAPASAPGNDAGEGEGWLRRSCALLEADLAGTVDLRGVAARAEMPYETWRRRFRSATGSSPYAYRADARLRAATELLTHTPLAVREIAASTGFTDERHLIRRFREHTGVTPRAFRDGLMDRGGRTDRQCGVAWP
ncbi:hypothetical protein GCM10009814_32760 [Lapillicoccus jejuensis]|uniref:AraC family transcriptional regulator n=1 Tax=Lapillicoccus jejuensis TaxID=402171 RepID=A0A542E4W5_9MICO|nr:AraC family transcriptional regulator [Lapillicoccus jejuensis]